jgi:hypothetical protein
MLDTHEVLRNGPYLRVTLPDALPPDWDALESDLDLELDEGVVLKATIVAPRCAPPGPMVDAVLRVASILGRQGVRVRIEPQPDEPFSAEWSLRRARENAPQSDHASSPMRRQARRSRTSPRG